MTKAQREVIRQGYLSRRGEFNEYHLLRHAEEVDGIVIPEMMRLYAKDQTVIFNCIREGDA